ncbi:DUF4221 family protein [Phocaeicola coprophilus]|jgi:hypothetical protein|uniref:DUF4221 family protein n=1 Tax=Phocaeicola coprophilus TaxID=387090 RepID=UPI0022E247B2|nr:DUF4221 family protein [Phocaeicola coprophilus]
MGKQLYTMVELPHKVFLLDDSTTQIVNHIQTYERNDSQLLALYNEPINNICIFDVKSGKEIQKIQFQKEGPNALDPNFCGFLIHNKDSIFMYHTWLWQLDLFNEKGELQKKYKIKDYPLESGCSFRRPDILPYSDTPIKKVDNYIILQGQGCNVCDSQSNQIPEGVTLLLNLKDSLVRHENGYPEIYNQKGIWQTFAYRVVPYDLSPQGEMVINYPAYDSIRVFNIHTKKTQCYFAGYSKPYTIHPARSEKEVDRSIMEQVQYTSIYYDKWNQLYYRLLTLPLSDYDVNEKSAPKRNLAVIILDKHFQKVGEYNIKEPSNRFSRAFVSSEGLHINILSDNDDYLTFITVKPKKL